MSSKKAKLHAIIDFFMLNCIADFCIKFEFLLDITVLSK